MLSEKYINQYTAEISQATEQIIQDAPPLCELKYFWGDVEKYFSLSPRSDTKPNIIVWGTTFPEELIYAFDVSPCIIAGGSLAVSALTDDELPRDTDAISRSAYGILANKLTEKSLVIIPITDDSSRKISYILKSKGVKVYTVDIPPAGSDTARAAWSYQAELCAEAIAKHLKRPFSKRRFKSACTLVYQAKAALRDFTALSLSRSNLIPDTLRMFIAYSYYCTENIAQWTNNLRQLSEKIKELDEDGASNKNSVLIVGSPIYFPNFKIPYLLKDAGLRIAANIDYAAIRAVNPLKPNKSFSDVMNDYYENDCSGAYAVNDRLYRYVEEAARRFKPDGIAFHILKGQIEYDYELSRMENMFNEKNIPVFRLETDYNKQDIEQLRIRAEAFGEVLQQRKYAEVKPI
ncbi:MAG: 2-hydroxyacyl-CoA dehydratase family protein [Clostridia bacterium]|nr:2-hydroxyacyl-CoA dehydratase family protein [Clostridia bacterium]